MNKNKLYELYHQNQIMEKLQIDQWKDLFKKEKIIILKEKENLVLIK